MTNGEKMQEIFPEGKTRKCRDGVVFESDGWCHAYDSDWWNTEHKEPTTKNDSSGLDKNSKKLEKDFGESDCISRQAVLELIADYDLSMGQVVRGIHALPPVTPQEPRKGHWVIKDKMWWVCSACGCQTRMMKKYNVPNFCPACGADMREVEE